LYLPFITGIYLLMIMVMGIFFMILMRVIMRSVVVPMFMPVILCFSIMAVRVTVLMSMLM